MQLPKKYEEEMQALLKEDFLLYKESLLKKRFFGLRVNNLKITTEEFEKISPFALKKIPWIENGFYYEEDERPAKHPYYFAGLYYIQEPSAMTPASLLPIDEGDFVLDVCAAPGGKTTELASKLFSSGILVSNDISVTRAKALLKNVEMAGVKNAYVISEDINKLVNMGITFDKILLDAPCSGEGMFRKDKKLIAAWEKNGVEYYSNIQKQLIMNAYKMLKKGGYLLYSTCTFNKKENEETITHLLKNVDDCEIVEVKKFDGFSNGIEIEEGLNLKAAVRLYPHLIDGEGHFVCLIRKRSEEIVKKIPLKKSQKRSTSKERIPKEVSEFLENIEVSFFKDGKIIIREDKVFMVNDEDFLKGVRILRNGLLLGTYKKNRFEPSTTLALSLKMGEYKNCISLPASDIRITKYLKGETIIFNENEQTAKDGFVLLCVDGYPLGFGKLSKNTMKNKYLASWRMN